MHGGRDGKAMDGKASNNNDKIGTLEELGSKNGRGAEECGECVGHI
jgi:hypothetical protein